MQGLGQLGQRIVWQDPEKCFCMQDHASSSCDAHENINPEYTYHALKTSGGGKSMAEPLPKWL